MRPRARSSLLALAKLLLLVVGSAAVAACGALATLLWTDWGHARVCRLVNRAITSQIAGELRVARIDALSLTQLTASGIEILAPDGVPAIEADRAVIDFSPRALLRGQFGWSRADISDCRVRVSEDHDHKTNMERTFAKRAQTSETKSREHSQDKLDLQSMVTSRCTLVIAGPDLPTLRLKDLQGIMRVRVLGDGDTELRFDRYAGSIDKGLPTGALTFHDLRGEVTTATKRLLRFVGEGRTRGTPVQFELDIQTEPKELVKIDAVFPEPAPGSLATEWASLWSRFSSTVEIDVHYDKQELGKR